VESVGQGVYDAKRRGFSSILKSNCSLASGKRDTADNAILQCMDLAGWSGVTTDDLLNGFYGVASRNCETRKLSSMVLRRM